MSSLEALATQSTPSPAASPVGTPPTAIVRPTLRRRGSIWVTVSSSTFATQSDPDSLSNASAPGLAPTDRAWTTLFVAGSMTATAWLSSVNGAPPLAVTPSAEEHDGRRERQRCQRQRCRGDRSASVAAVLRIFGRRPALPWGFLLEGR